MRKTQNRSDWFRVRRARLKAQGVCVDCSKQPAGEGHSVCPTCRFKRILCTEKRNLRLASEGWKPWRAA
jgi:hypothetical protein